MKKKSHPAQKILTAITMEKHLPLKVAKSKVTFTGEQKAMPDGERHEWVSDKWQYNKKGKLLP